MTHYIHKLSLDVRAPKTADGFALQSEMSQQFWATIAPVLSDVFDQFATDDEVIRIEKLDIDLTNIDFNNWQAEMPPSVKRAIFDKLERLLKYGSTESLLLHDIKVKKQPLSKNQFEAWLYFLKTGQLPKTVHNESAWQQAALATVAANAESSHLLRGLLAQDFTVRERLILQHNNDFLVQLAEAMSGQKQSDLVVLQQSLSAIWTASFFTKMVKTAFAKSSKIDLPTARELEILFWQMIFLELSKGVKTIDNQWFIIIFLNHFLQKIFKSEFVKLLAAVSFQTAISSKTPNNSKLKTRNSKLPSDTEGVNFDIEIEKNRPLSIAPNFSQFIKQTISNTTISDAIILFFETQISQHKSEIQQIIDPSVSNRVSKKFRIEKEKIGEELVDKSENESVFDKKTTDLTKLEKTEIAKANENLEEETAKNERGEEEQTTEKETEPMNLIAPNAGLILLHPFLKPYFESLNLLRGGKFENRADQKRAAALLHYLATGTTEMPEYEMTMPKLMVGLSLNTPLDRQVDLTEIEKTEANELLRAVIKHWQALGDSSPDALREGFLQRTGKLTRRDNGYLIQIEAKTLDILLDRLPWGIGIVKLSWMREFLFVEWH